MSEQNRNHTVTPAEPASGGAAHAGKAGQRPFPGNGEATAANTGRSQPCRHCGEVHPGGRFVRGCPGPRLRGGQKSEHMRPANLPDDPDGRAAATRALVAVVAGQLHALTSYMGQHKPRARDVRDIATAFDLLERLDQLNESMGLWAKSEVRAFAGNLTHAFLRHVPDNETRLRIAAELRALGERDDDVAMDLTLPEPRVGAADVLAALADDDELRRAVRGAVAGELRRDGEWRLSVLRGLASEPDVADEMFRLVSGARVANEEVPDVVEILDDGTVVALEDKP